MAVHRLMDRDQNASVPVGCFSVVLLCCANVYTLELISSTHCGQCFGSLGVQNIDDSVCVCVCVCVPDVNSNVHCSNKTILKKILQVLKWSGPN